jgi:hypothetical protein
MVAVQEAFGKLVAGAETLRPLSHSIMNVGASCITAATLIAFVFPYLLRKQDFAIFNENVECPP